MRVPKRFSVIIVTIVALTGAPRPANADQLGSLLGALILPDAGRIADIWGHVDPGTGKEYAFVGHTTGFHLVDVSDPSDPFLVLSMGNTHGFDLKTHGDYLYVTLGNAFGQGDVINISTITYPYEVGTFFSSHNLAIDPRGYLIAIGGGQFNDLAIFDINTDPVSPALEWRDLISDSHDASVVDTMLYDFHGEKGTRIYSVSDPTNPVYLGRVLDAATVTYHHSGYPTEDGKHLFITNELAEHPMADITVWNIENPAVPYLVASIGDSTATAHNLYIIDDYAFASYYTAGFKVFDVGDPTMPVLVYEYDTSADSGEVWRGAFGVYPFTPSGNIYVSDRDNGFFVFSIAEGATAVLITRFQASYADAGVRLTWDIGSADGLQGFHIYRSSEPSGGLTRINPQMVGAEDAYEFTDNDVQPGATYWYRLGAIDDDGEFFSHVQKVRIPDTGLTLRQNYPNPFNPSTRIEYELPAAGHVTLAVYDAEGRRVRTLIDRHRSSGPHMAMWDGRDDEGRFVATGVYFYRIVTTESVQTKRMVFLK